MAKGDKTKETPVPFRHRFMIKPGTRVDLSAIDPDEDGGLKKQEARDELDRLRTELRDLQERFYAWDKRSLLIVLQAMDTGGKDGAIENVTQGVNPQGVYVAAFKVPTPEELSHDFLWRVHKVAPPRRMIGIFNRSHYEDVLVVRVHNLAPEEVWRKRYGHINAFERLLSDNGAVILKFYLHISKDEQARRLQSRLDDPNKRWKFASGDLKERERWDDYMAAYADAVSLCSTEYAPWYVIPANNKWYRDVIIARTIVETIKDLDPQYPQPEEGLENIKIV